METTALTRQHVAKLVKESGNDRFVDRMIVRLQEAFIAPDKGVSPTRDGFLRGPGDTAVIEWMPHHDPGHFTTIKMVACTEHLPTWLFGAVVVAKDGVRTQGISF
ncbi:hypothetical protein ACIBQ3_05825 [Streptomyces rubiginosohelvolus]|uniref:hypothetical protein n=1 Tax=Streptomyces rubiginosohelvolus TaxID=67362 RepID=UPI0037BC7BEF